MGCVAYDWAMPKPLRLLHVASELAPLIKTGGLADVVGALPKALRRAKQDARVVIPGYQRALHEGGLKWKLKWHAKTMIIETGGIDHSVGIAECDVDGLPVYLVACDELFGREGVYGPSPSNDYEDNCRRFSLFAKAALALPGFLDWQPHVVHAHDWQAGLVPALLQRGFSQVLPATRSVFSIHNIAYQGSFWHWDMKLTGLDWSLFNPLQCEHYGKLNLLKSGIVFADRVTTVSRRYAEELQAGDYSFQLDPVVRAHAYKLSGITNGIDTDEWNPATDRHLPATYSPRDLAGKAACRRALQTECGLSTTGNPCVVGVISRLVDQKGIDLIIDTVTPYILAGRMQLVVLGAGDLGLEHRISQLVQRHPGWVYAWYGHNEAMAHRIMGGADLFLVPSRTEPCGLTQMYAKRYGTLPLVRFTGGLADTVTDVAAGSGTGFTFGPIDLGHFSSALDRALGLFQHFPADWRAAQLRAMADDHSWDTVALEYLELYRRITWPE